ncbi:MAG: hypothetical protein ACJA0H_002365, partial [Francisellaceae bacterium]
MRIINASEERKISNLNGELTECIEAIEEFERLYGQIPMDCLQT